MWEPGEPVVSGATVQLWEDNNGDGILDTGIGGDLLVATATTDAFGIYTFNSVNTGTYFVRIIVPPGFVSTTPAVLTEEITVNGTVITDADLELQMKMNL